MGVGEGTHNGTDGEAVEIVIDEDENAENEGGKHCAAAALDVGGCPAAEGCGAACCVYESDHSAQKDQEEENTCVPGVCKSGQEAVIENGVQGADGGEAGVEQSAYNDSDKEGGISLLGDESKNDCYDGGDECPESADHWKYLRKRKIVMNTADTVP